MKKKNQTQNQKIQNENVDKSPNIPQRNKIRTQLTLYEPQLTDKQKEFLELALDKKVKIIFISGPAGSSKTYMAVYAALLLLNSRRVSDLIYVRSAVESSDSKLGFLPGEANEKMSPYIQPLLDKLSELLNKNDLNILNKEERISSIPIGFLRGLNWNAKVIIGDEMQNTTFKELFTLITRTGEFSKVFLLGDPDQSDINGKSGFLKMISYFDDEESKENGIYTFRFTEDDIVRSSLIKYIIKKLKKSL
jgi:phosphate starvation-inducible PhoH-like protein